MYTYTYSCIIRLYILHQICADRLNRVTPLRSQSRVGRLQESTPTHWAISIFWEGGSSAARRSTQKPPSCPWRPAEPSQAGRPAASIGRRRRPLPTAGRPSRWAWGARRRPAAAPHYAAAAASNTAGAANPVGRAPSSRARCTRPSLSLSLSLSPSPSLRQSLSPISSSRLRRPVHPRGGHTRPSGQFTQALAAATSTLTGVSPRALFNQHLH
eukprot:SAG22_NODE_1150_length_5351_cov_3.848439_5_plen_213_part_00